MRVGAGSVRIAVLAGALAVATGGVVVATSGAATGPAAAASRTADSPVQDFRSVRTLGDVAEPVRVRIPAIGVTSELLRLHRAPDGSIEVPGDYATAGWFAEGPRPGQPGPAVMLGHVDSKAGPAVFWGLRQLAPGDGVLVDRADGSTITFHVRSTVHVPKTQFPTDLVYAPTLEPSLRLVTCGGVFDHARRSYLDNVIVYADP